MLTDEERATYAASAPVYVDPAEDGTWRLMSTETAEVISSEHATAKTALASALEGGLLTQKKAVLRSDGEPDGAWRWHDASAEEDEPGPDEVRIGEVTLWDMAASLNTSAKPAAVNGGGAEEGYATSEPHGDAYNQDGAHPANGWAHAGAVVYEQDGRPHLYLWSELIESVAKEMDRGRLAFGSVYFGYAALDKSNNNAALGAELISHALTNDPAVKTLSPGSERNNKSGGRRRAYRSAWRASMADDSKPTITDEQAEALRATLADETQSKAVRARAGIKLLATRGQMADTAQAVSDILGVAQTDQWALIDAVYDLAAGVRAEKLIEAAGGGAPAPESPPAETPEPVAAQQQRAAREVEGVEPDAVEPLLETFIELGRTVLGKPDATPADVAEELTARSEEIGAALDTDTPPDDGEGEEDDGEETEMTEAERSSPIGQRVLRERGKRRAAKAALKAEKKKVARFEERDWLTAELAKIKKTLPKERFDRWVEIGLKSGRAVVEELVANYNAPPSDDDHPMNGARDKGPTPATLVIATNELVPEAREALRSERGKDEDIPAHIVVARAQKMATERYPELAG